MRQKQMHTSCTHQLLPLLSVPFNTRQLPYLPQLERLVCLHLVVRHNGACKGTVVGLGGRARGKLLGQQQLQRA